MHFHTFTFTLRPPSSAHCLGSSSSPPSSSSSSSLSSQVSVIAASTYGCPLLGMHDFPAWANTTDCSTILPTQWNLNIAVFQLLHIFANIFKVCQHYRLQMCRLAAKATPTEILSFSEFFQSANKSNVKLQTELKAELTKFQKYKCVIFDWFFQQMSWDKIRKIKFYTKTNRKLRFLHFL